MKNTLKILTMFAFASMLMLFVTSCGEKAETDKPATGDMTEETGAVTGEPVEEIPAGDEAELNTGEKFDARLIEAIANAEKGGVNPNFALDIILNTAMSDPIVSALEAKGVDVIYGEGTKLRVVATPKVLNEIKPMKYINNIVLITENYYPNR